MHSRIGVWIAVRHNSRCAGSLFRSVSVQSAYYKTIFGGHTNFFRSAWLPAGSLIHFRSICQKAYNSGKGNCAVATTFRKGKERMLLAMKDEGNQCAPEKETLLAKAAASSKVFTFPTILTLGRVAAIPILLFVFYSKECWATVAGASIFVLAGITDWLDGYLARKMGSSSAFGAFLDPVADKLLVATTLVLLCTKPPALNLAKTLPWLIPVPATAIIGREIAMSAVREWAATQGKNLHGVVAVNNLGKWKTASQMMALTVLLATRDGSQHELAFLLGAVGVGMLYISAGLALWSLYVYVKGIWRELIK